MKKIVLSAFVLMFFSTAVVVDLARPVEVIGTIYIFADGSISPSTANITTIDNVTYTLTGNIITNGGIVVQRDNIVVDGAGFTLEGDYWHTPAAGIDLERRNNVTIKNMQIMVPSSTGIRLDHSFNIKIYQTNITDTEYCIRPYSSWNNIISGNRLENGSDGVWGTNASHNIISDNYIAGHAWSGITLDDNSRNNTISGNLVTTNMRGGITVLCSNNTIRGNSVINNSGYTSEGIGIVGFDNRIFDNNVSANDVGIVLDDSSRNIIYDNNIADNYFGGISMIDSWNNLIYHNNMDNVHQVLSDNSTNSWDNGYPSGGNYWSNFKNRHPDVGDDYQGPNQDQPGSDGIWDQPYIIGENNQDNYPLVPEFPPMLIMPLFMIATLLTAILLERRKHFRR